MKIIPCLNRCYFSLYRASFMRMSIAVMLWAVAGLSGADSAPAQPHNILLIIADDVGVDMIGAYQPLVGSNSVPQTPTIDSLAAQGILFRNAWANPLCAATRASIQTGRYGFRTGVKGATGVLPANEFSIGKILHRDPANQHALALFGKWGLSSQPGGSDPVRMGYDSYAGVLGAQLAVGDDYSNFTEQVISFNESSSCDQHNAASYNGTACITSATAPVNIYATTKNADDTIAWINAVHNQSGGARPWFVTLSFNAAHTPLHAPPPALIHATNCTVLNSTNSRNCYRAMIEAMDTEIKRVLDNIPPAELSRTTIIFIGDNGSERNMAVAPFDGSKAKYSVYEGGVNVPLIIAGSDVATKSRISKALVNASDLFMTVLDIAGFDHNYLPVAFNNAQPWLHDSRSLVPILNDPCADGCQIQTLRQFVYAEVSLLGSGYAVRDFAGYKLMLFGAGSSLQWSFYDLAQDPYELVNLVDASTGNLLAGSTDAGAAQALAKLRQMLPGVTPLVPNILPVNVADVFAHTGDINGDQKVDVTDVLLATQSLIGTRVFTAQEVARSDIYPQTAGDGELTIADLILLNKWVLSR
jgi:arylsulfatase A-like enzyme